MAALRIVYAADLVLPALGGAERFPHELLGILAARGDDVAMVGCDAPQVRTGTREAPPGVAWHPVVRAAEPAGTGRWAARRARCDAVAARVAQLLRDRGADIVVTQMFAAPPVVEAAGAAGVPAVVLVPGFEALCHWRIQLASGCRPETRCTACPRTLALGPAERTARLWWRAAFDRALQDAAALIAPSEAMAAECERAAGRPAIAIAPVTGSAAPVAARVDGHLALISTAWTREKGVELVAPLARALGDRRFVVQVCEGDITGAARAELTATENVELRDRPGEIGDVLDGAAALLVPSLLPEPFGRVAFEAMSAGVPTLASRVGGLPEFVPAGQLVDPPADPVAWTRAIRALEAAPAWEAARAAGVAAAAAVLERGSAGDVEAILRSVASQGNPELAGGLLSAG